MSEQSVSKSGSIIWTDLTVPNADEIRDFYAQVVGWQPEEVDIGGGYSDYNMKIPGLDTPAAGICWSKGINQGIPPQWMIYIVVEEMQESLRRCEHLGGKVLYGPRSSGGGGLLCIIQDPAGAVAALIQNERAD